MKKAKVIDSYDEQKRIILDDYHSGRISLGETYRRLRGVKAGGKISLSKQKKKK